MKVLSCEIEELYYVECVFDYDAPFHKYHSRTPEEILEKINNDIDIHNKELIDDGCTDYLLEPLSKIVLDEDIKTGGLSDSEVVCKGNFVVLEFDDGSIKYVLL